MALWEPGGELMAYLEATALINEFKKWKTKYMVVGKVYAFAK